MPISYWMGEVNCCKSKINYVLNHEEHIDINFISSWSSPFIWFFLLILKLHKPRINFCIIASGYSRGGVVLLYSILYIIDFIFDID